MSSIALPGLYAPETIHSVPRARTGGRQEPTRPPRRRASIAQGQALESIGHAVEYLVDQRMFEMNESNARADQEAIQILMRMSRAVFAECREVVPLGTRVSLWFGKGLRRW